MPVTSNRIYNYPNFLSINVEDGAPTSYQYSLQDRVPAGKYAIVRSLYAPLADILSDAIALNLTGLIFLVSDSNNDIASFSPSGASSDTVGYIQNALYSDLNPTPIDRGKFHGPKTFRQKDKTLVIGGLFVCGHQGFSLPEEEGYGIAEIMNKLELDFACIDFDNKGSLTEQSTFDWNQEGASTRSLVINQIVLDSLENFPYKIGAGFPAISSLTSYRPIFNVLPSTTSGNEYLLSSDGVYEPFQNGFTSPRVYGMPRVKPTSNSFNDVSLAWDWAKPLSGYPRNLGRCEMVVDVRGGTSYIQNFVDTAVNGIPKSMGAGLDVNVQSGVIVYDDLQTLKSIGSAPGANPTKYWDYSGREVWGSYCAGFKFVPSFYGDTGQSFSKSTTEDYTFYDGEVLSDAKFVTDQYIVVENWKTGHLENRTHSEITFHPSLGLPGTVNKNEGQLVTYPETFSLPDEPDVKYFYPRTYTNSWISFNGDGGDYPTQEPFVLKIHRTLTDGTQIDLINQSINGTPILGDEGLYPLLMEIYRTDSKGIRIQSDYTEMSLFIQVNRDITQEKKQILDSDIPQFQKDIKIRQLEAFNSYPYQQYSDPTETGLQNRNSKKIVNYRDLNKRLPYEWGPLNDSQGNPVWVNDRNHSPLIPVSVEYAAANDATVEAPYKKGTRIVVKKSSIPSAGPPPSSYNYENPTHPDLQAHFAKAPLEVRKAIAQSGFPWTQWEFAAWVSQYESSWRPDVVNTSSGYTCVGLFQINISVHTQYTFEAMKNFDANAVAAFNVWKAQGWKAWDAAHIDLPNVGFKSILTQQTEAGVPIDKRIQLAPPTQDQINVSQPPPSGAAPTDLSGGSIYLPFARGVQYQYYQSPAEHREVALKAYGNVDPTYFPVDLSPLFNQFDKATGLLTLYAPCDARVISLGYTTNPNEGIVCHMESVYPIAGYILDIKYLHLAPETLNVEKYKVSNRQVNNVLGKDVGYLGVNKNQWTGKSFGPHVHIEIRGTQIDEGQANIQTVGIDPTTLYRLSPQYETAAVP